MLNRLLGIGIALAFIPLTYDQLAYRFRNFTINDGLSQSSVRSIVQDDIGTLWIGTQDGLNRFDGQQFQVFTSDDNPGLESEYIHASLKDKNGVLWFGTSNGLTAFNPLKEAFKTFSLKNGNAISIETMAEASNGDIYLGTSTQGLAIFKKASSTIELVNVRFPSKRLQYLSFLSSTSPKLIFKV